MVDDWTEREVLLHANGQFYYGCLRTKASSDSCFISLIVDIGVKLIELDSSSGDFFNALVKVREELEKEHYMLCCNGSRLNFYPSNMSIQMSKGKVGYLLELGVRASKKARTLDLCDKLEYMSTVSSQLIFFKKWKDQLEHSKNEFK